MFFAYPNPARQRVLFSLVLESGGRAQISLFNLSGERLALLEETLPPGVHALPWDASAAAPGVYLARCLVDGREIGRRKIAILK
ncbi:MAG: T9SS type A sorting domain-containing protein [Candidatus Firestonebacteria bacterium]|nr:T9SS type A sorting domain-containing protein [Candidatus Firestonebacteria bacterium]